MYDVEINKMLNNGYVEHVQPDELDVALLKWYVAHHYVLLRTTLEISVR